MACCSDVACESRPVFNAFFCTRLFVDELVAEDTPVKMCVALSRPSTNGFEYNSAFCADECCRRPCKAVNKHSAHLRKSFELAEIDAIA